MVSRLRLSVVIGCLLLTLVTASATGATTGTATPFQHVIIIVQENHSFDNYFGTYPTANGTLVTPITSELTPVIGIPNGVCLPYGDGCVRPRFSNSTGPVDPVEGQLVYENDYANNATGFPENSGVQSMIYFDYHSIPAYWDYAEEYGLADNYFAPVLTQTNANRLMLLTGNTSVAADQSPTSYIPYSETIMSQLDGAGVSWGYYDYFPTNGSPLTVHPLNYISDWSQQDLSHVQDLSSLYKDLSNGTGLPAVSFVNSLGNKTYDEHPQDNPTAGEQWVVSVVNKVMSSSYWDSTVIFITWDEGGGFYDQVVPPHLFTIDNNFTSPVIGLGQRIPLLVISPFSKESYVSNTLMSHLSLDHFIDYNWNITPLNSIIANSNLPLGFFDFAQTPRSPLILQTSGANSMSTYPIPLQLPLEQSATQTSTRTSGSQLSTTLLSSSGSVTTSSHASLTGTSPSSLRDLSYALLILAAGVATASLILLRGRKH